MELEQVVFKENPEKIAQEPYDCIWVILEARKAPSPLKSAALQCLDWKLQGQLSRYLKEGGAEGTTFIPTMHKVSSPFLAVDSSGEPKWESFSKNCQGQQWKQVLCFVESKELSAGIEKQLKKASRDDYPQMVFLGSDGK